MRAVVGMAGAAALGTAAAVLPAHPASAGCGVFDKRPCAPTVCSLFRHRPCIPEFELPIGQDLRLTIESAAVAGEPASGQGPGAEHKLNTIRDVFDALRACWMPPPEDEARPGMQMSVRLSFKRTGEIIGTPRVTYATADTSSGVRDAYRHAITAALDRCTPMPFTSGLGGAIAGRPIAIRYVDNRSEHP